MLFSRGKDIRSGFTLMELVIFVALFGVITTSFIAIFITVTKVQSNQGVSIGVNQESRFLLDTINSYVKESSVIEIPYNSGESSSTLKLRMASSSTDPVYIRFTSSTGAVTIQVSDDGSEEPLISSRVKVSDLNFTKHSNANSKDVLEFSFTMASTLSTSSPNYVSREFNTSISRVTNAIFDTDIEKSGPSLLIGASTTHQFSGINNTIFFAKDDGVWGDILRWLVGPTFPANEFLSGWDTFVGIGPYKFRPTERLHIVDGGVRFDPAGTARPTCVDATHQGLLWFQSSTLGITDTMAACLKSNTGDYYWTGDYINDYTTTTVDNINNTGQYTSIDAIRPDGTSTISVGISYFETTNNSLMFARSDDDGANWQTRVVHATSSNGGIGHDNSIAMPSTSTVYISYYKPGTVGNALYFARSFDGGIATPWETKIVPGATGNNNGQHTSIVAPTTSTIYIAYYAGGPADLMLAYSFDKGDTWSVTPVMTDGGVGKYSSIDSVGTSTIMISTFQATPSQKLMFARIEGGPTGTITTSTIFDSYSDVGRSNSMQAITSSTILASLYDGGVGLLKFTRSDLGGINGSWLSPVLVDASGSNTGENNAIASHNGSLIHIAYWIPNGGSGVEGFKVSTSFDGGASWPSSRQRLVDSANSTGKWPDIVAVDGATVFASYYKGNSPYDDLISFRSINPPLFDY